MRPSKLITYLFTVTVSSVPAISLAGDISAALPDEAFLEFLASMSDVNGEVTDPLDMLALAEDELSADKSAKENKIEKALLDESSVPAESKAEVKNEFNAKSNMAAKENK